MHLALHVRHVERCGRTRRRAALARTTSCDELFQTAIPRKPTLRT
jgi:hypothetical protein